MKIDSKYKFDYNQIIRICPHCQHAFIPEIIGEEFIETFSDMPGLENYVSILKCPNCGKVIIANFNVIAINSFEDSYFDYSDIEIYPNKPISKVNFSEVIKNISPKFIETFKQSEIAEEQSLNEISGTGYRKAFEYLVKDYACSIETDHSKHDAIKSDWLSKVINERIDNEPLKNICNRINWLATDHGHYYKKYTNYDIDDLKKIIKVMTDWIELLHSTNEILKIQQQK